MKSADVISMRERVRERLEYLDNYVGQIARFFILFILKIQCSLRILRISRTDAIWQTNCSLIDLIRELIYVIFNVIFS